MSDVGASATPAAPSTQVVKAVSAKTEAPPQAGETPEGHPVREWIDTLLMAAVMAKGKKKHAAEPTNKDEISHTDNTGTIAADGDGDRDRDRDGDGAGNVEVAVDVGVTQAVAIFTKAEPRDEPGPAVVKGDQADGAEQMDPAGEDPDRLDKEDKQFRRRHCKVVGCTKFARYRRVCSGHGGRRVCSHTDCDRVAQFGHKCSAHGGVKYCSVDGCKRAVQSRGFCKTHGGGVRCKHPGCDKGAISKGHCRTHGGGSRCAEEGCQKWAQRHGFCVRHSKAATAALPTDAVMNTAQV